VRVNVVNSAPGRRRDLPRPRALFLTKRCKTGVNLSGNPVIPGYFLLLRNPGPWRLEASFSVRNVENRVDIPVRKEEKGEVISRPTVRYTTSLRLWALIKLIMLIIRHVRTINNGGICSTRECQECAPLCATVPLLRAIHGVCTSVYPIVVSFLARRAEQLCAERHTTLNTSKVLSREGLPTHGFLPN